MTQKVEIQKIKDDVAYIKKVLSENGLIKEVYRNRDFRLAYFAKSSVYKFLLGGGWATTLVLLGIQIYLNS